MQIRLYTVLGKYDDYENFIKDLVNTLRSELSKRGIDPDKISLTLIKIKPEVIDDVLKMASNPEIKPPSHLKYLIQVLRQDSVTMIPTIIINGKKVFEGSLPSHDELKKLLYDEVSKEFNITFEITKPKEEELTIPKPVSIEEKPFSVEAPLSHKFILGKPKTCRECIYFGSETSYCFLLGCKVENPEKPICKLE